MVRTGAAYLTEDVKWRATNWLRNDLARHCLKLDMAFHNEHTPGAMIERIDGDVNELSNFFSQFVIRILGNGLLMIGILVLLTREDWRIGAALHALRRHHGPHAAGHRGQHRRALLEGPSPGFLRDVRPDRRVAGRHRGYQRQRRHALRHGPA